MQKYPPCPPCRQKYRCGCEPRPLFAGTSAVGRSHLAQFFLSKSPDTFKSILRHIAPFCTNFILTRLSHSTTDTGLIIRKKTRRLLQIVPPTIVELRRRGVRMPRRFLHPFKRRPVPQRPPHPSIRHLIGTFPNSSSTSKRAGCRHPPPVAFRIVPDEYPA